MARALSTYTEAEIAYNEIRSDLHCTGVAYGLRKPDATPEEIAHKTEGEFIYSQRPYTVRQMWMYVVFTQGFEEGKRLAQSRDA